METKKAYINNTVWILIHNIVKLAGGFFVGVWVANHLGRELYGILNYPIVLHGMFFMLIDLGLGHVLVKKLIEEKEKQEEYINTVFILKTFGSILAFILVNITAYFNIENFDHRILVFIFSLHYFSMIFDVFNSSFQANVRDKFRIISHIISFTLSSIAKVFMILNDAPLYLFASSYLIDFFIAAFLKYYFYKRNGKNLRLKFDKQITKILFNSSWAIALTFFFNKVITQVDRLMIGNMLDRSALGIYSASTDIIYPLANTTTIISASFISYLMSLRFKNEELYRLRFFQIFNIITWIGIITSIILGLASEFIINTIYSKEFAYAHLPFAIGIWEFMFALQLSFINIWLINEDKQNYQLALTIIAAILNIIGNYLLITRMGIIGAAISTAFVRVSTVLFLPLLFKNIRYISLVSLESLNPLTLFTSIKAFTSR